MANFRSPPPCVASILLLNPYCLAAITDSFSTSEQLLWTQGLPKPISELTATVITLASRSSSSDSTGDNPTTTPDTRSCSATSISCPDCNVAYILDSENTEYHVFCNSRLYSDSPYPVQRWLSAEGCIAECSKYSSCKGVTSWEDGNCQLARGQNVFPQYDEDHVALLQIPEGFAAPSPATVPGAFPIGNVPLPAPSVATPSERPGRCNLRDIECPFSRGETITEGFNETYTVRCNFQPICSGFTTVGLRQSKCSCLAQCDRDPECLAALFNRGKCDLCHGSLEGLSTYTSPRNYIVFVPEAPVVETSASLETTSFSTATGKSRSRLTPTSISVAGSTTSSTRQNSTPRSTRPTTSTISSFRASMSTIGPLSSRRTSTTNPISVFTSTSTRSSSTSGPPTSQFTTPVPSPIPHPQPQPSQPNLNPARLSPLSSAACPSSDNTNVYAPSNNRNYIIQCDVTFDAAVTNITNAEDLSACAGECGGKCGGMVFHTTDGAEGAAGQGEPQEADGGTGEWEEEEGGCTLFTGISAIQSRAGATAGVWIRFPGTVPAGLFATTTTSTAFSSSSSSTTTMVTGGVPGLAASAMSAASSRVGVVPSRVAGS